MLPQPTPANYQQLQNIQQMLNQLQGQNGAWGGNTMLQPPAPPAVPQQMHYVDGVAGAKEYLEKMPPNSSEAVMDKNENIFYPLSKDANGQSAKKLTICRFTIEEEQEQQPDNITRKDFEDFKAEIVNLLKREDKA